MHRRHFIKAVVGAVSITVAPVAFTAESKHFYSCRSGYDGRHYLSGQNLDGISLFDIQLPGRGHGLVHRPNGEVAVLARRPGDFLWVIDSKNGEVLYKLTTTKDRHFYGHGTYNHNGDKLYTSENNFETGEGVIGIYNAASQYERIGEIRSYGIGPHELTFLHDKATLVIANGGIKTHPDTGRSKLNLSTMSPSLVYVEAASGNLIGRYKLAESLHQNSIRHLAVGSDDRVWFVMQYQGERRRLPDLVGVHQQGNALKTLRAPEQIQSRMKNYCGSICLDSTGTVAAISSPRGDLVTLWSVNHYSYLGHVNVKDGCGVAAGDSPGEFILSSGLGSVVRYVFSAQDKGKPQSIPSSDLRWDNHLLSV